MRKLSCQRLGTSDGNRSARVHHGVTGDGIVHREARPQALPVLVIGWLRVEVEGLLRIVVPVGNVLAAGVDESGQRGTILGFVDAAVHFVAQSVVDGQIRPRLPGVLEVEVVGLAADRSFIETIAGGRDVGGGHDAVRIRRGGQQSGQRIGQRISRLNIVGAAGRSDQHGRIRRASAKRVLSVGIGPENRSVAVVPDFHSPLEDVIGVHVAHVVLELVEIAVRSENRTAGRVEGQKKAVAESHGRLGVVDGGEKGRAANVAERSVRNKVRRNGARIFHAGVALVIEKLYRKAGINRRLVGIGQRPGHLVEAEPGQ